MFCDCLNKSGGSKESKSSPSFESSHGLRGKNQQHRSNTLFNIFVYRVVSWVLGFETSQSPGAHDSWPLLFPVVWFCEGLFILAKVKCSGQGSAAPWDQLEKDRRREKQHHRDGHWGKYFQMSLSFKHIYKQGSIRLLFAHFRFFHKGEYLLTKYINLGDKNLGDDF